jgi:hypothetical protein
LLQQLAQSGTSAQDAQTAAAVSQFVKSNPDLIATILKGYIAYLKQIQSMTAEDGSAQTPAGQSSAAATPGTSAQSADSTAAQSNSIQPSTGLQITGVQAATGLQTSHLAGYPSLPDVNPVSSITQPTAAQLEYAAKIQKEDQARKAYLMAHPEGYSY